MAFRTNKTPVLQEKSASGSVATFNTALAMPLASCNIAVNAWQEGSGEPSPSNVRPIHGFSEVNVTANNIVTTIQLGQEVYGAEVDVVNGVAHVTDVKEVFDLSDYATTYIVGDFIRYSYNLAYAPIRNNTQECNIAPFAYNNNENLHFYCDKGTYNRLQLFLPNDITSATIEVKYPLETPFDIQLSDIPTLSTIIGNNTIFADTGDIDLTYKDLDIAKRGNFREVFKLPS